jgi:hypothetical protein
MQRKAIEVGKEYGILARVQNKGREKDAHGPAKVVALDAEYERTVGSYSIRKEKMHDGIAVVFDHDVKAGYGGYRPAKPGEKSGTWDKVIPAGTKIVLDSPKLIVGEWAPIAEMRARWEAEKNAEKKQIDAEGDVFEARFEAIVTALAERGIEDTGSFDTPVRVRDDVRNGASGKRIVGATWTLTSDTIETLLGIGGKA